MICTRCIRQSLRLAPKAHTTTTIRTFSASRPFLLESTPATSSPAVTSQPSLAQPFSTPLTSSSTSPSALGSVQTPPSNSKSSIVSSCAAGTPLKGLNYMKGRDDPVALPEEEYPEWLWRCLDKKVDEVEGGDEGDAFSKSAKLRRKAAKRARKLELLRLASGEAAPEARIPLTQQSIDLPSNTEGTTEGAFLAEEKREELRGAMRTERRKGIKEANFLKGM